MSKQGWAMLAGIVLIVGGLALFFAFLETETSVIGLRQVGLILAVLGAIDVAATGWTMIKSRQLKNSL